MLSGSVKVTVSNHVVNIQVIWRRQHELHPLTVGLDIFASDASITVEKVPQLSESGEDVSEWRLILNSVRHQDAGVYHCQVTAKQLRRRSFDVRLRVKGMSVDRNNNNNQTINQVLFQAENVHKY